MTRWGKALIAGAVAAVFAVPGVPWALGIKRVAADAEPAPVEGRLSYDGYDAVLKRFVRDDGTVDYAGLAADDEGLRRFVATLGEVGPRTRPELFPTDADAFAWHINAYNAVTLLGIVAHWPNEGVHDIGGPLSPKPGFGFFFGLRFRLDGRWTNTYDFENKVMRERFDARLHAAINCASASCPRLSRDAYRPETLDAQLDAATREFVSTPPHVAFDPAQEVVALSSIFRWFAGDFVAHTKDDGGSVLRFIERYATPQVAAQAKVAREAGWTLRYVDYDWSLNGP